LRIGPINLPHVLAVDLAPRCNAIIVGFFTLAGVYLTARSGRALDWPTPLRTWRVKPLDGLAASPVNKKALAGYGKIPS
jgi:hypothetical protein